MTEERKLLSRYWDEKHNFMVVTEKVYFEGFEIINMGGKELDKNFEKELKKLTKPNEVVITYAETFEGHKIGECEWAVKLSNHGIKPELAEEGNNICSIGFCQKEQKWYGWSHRAIGSFGIGSKVKMGDVAFMPSNEEEALESELRFWDEEDHLNTRARISYDSDGKKIIRIEWEYGTTVPNKKLHNTTSGITAKYPEKFGHGEWEAKSLSDAKQMAIDYAKNIN